jgi:hypothetical protein
MKIGEIFPPPEGGKAGTNKSQKPFYTKFLTVPHFIFDGKTRI